VDGVGASRHVFASIALARHVEGVGALLWEELEELRECGEQVGTDGTLVSGHALQRVLVENEVRLGVRVRVRVRFRVRVRVREQPMGN
jgi:hypothetical protein